MESFEERKKEATVTNGFTRRAVGHLATRLCSQGKDRRRRANQPRRSSGRGPLRTAAALSPMKIERTEGGKIHVGTGDFTCCVTVGKLLNLSEPQGPHLHKKD